MNVRVGPNFLDSNSSRKQSLNIDNTYVMYDGRIVGRVVDCNGNYTELQIIDQTVKQLIKNGMFDQPVSMGCRVEGGQTDENVKESKVNKGYGGIDRLKILEIMED